MKSLSARAFVLCVRAIRSQEGIGTDALASSCSVASVTATAFVLAIRSPPKALLSVLRSRKLARNDMSSARTDIYAARVHLHAFRCFRARHRVSTRVMSSFEDVPDQEATVSRLTQKAIFSAMTKPSHATIIVERYPGTSRILHWIVALLVLATWPLGFAIQYLTKDVSLTAYMFHESFGFLVLWLMLVRVGNRLVVPTPKPEGPKIARLAAGMVHGLLYLFLIVMPVSGFLATNAYGFPLLWFGLIAVWSPIGTVPAAAAMFSAVHMWSAWILLLLFALHAAAVLLHHVFKRDLTLYRIL